MENEGEKVQLMDRVVAAARRFLAVLLAAVIRQGSKPRPIN